MTHRLWWRVEEILPLAEHAAATPQQRKTRQQERAGWRDVPALIWSREPDGDWLTSNGVPIWYGVGGTEYRVRAETWPHTATGATGNPRPNDDGDGFLPLHAVHLDGRRALLDLLRFAREHEVPWLGVNADRNSETGKDRYLLSLGREDVLPPDASWVTATVTSDTVGGGYYSALVADGYTALDGGPLCRFPHDEVGRMAGHLNDLSIGDGPSEHPILFLAHGFVIVYREEDTGEDSRRWIEEDRVPADADDHYAIGAYQWRWTRATTVKDPS